jgi:hypothetical protein
VITTPTNAINIECFAKNKNKNKKSVPNAKKKRERAKSESIIIIIMNLKHCFALARRSFIVSSIVSDVSSSSF